ncbi:MAG: CoA ester lyase [Actinomycetia bacterium]|nr:CoA ester lyase [Actinomycetes bacterium]
MIGPLIPLYVPGDRPDRYDKAMASQADAVIIDLEDAVSAGHKQAARTAATEYLMRAHRKPVHVRINHPGSGWGTADLAALTDLPGLAAIRIPKVESAAEVRAVACGVPLYCVIESALGVEAAYQIATAHPDVSGIGLGEADLAGDLGGTGDDALLYARSRIIVAARAAALPPPLLSVFPDLGDPDGLHASCLRGRRLGFVGRALIHPRQAGPVLAAFAPDQTEVASAERLLAGLREAHALDGGTLVLPDGSFADRAMAHAARRVLAVRDAIAASAAPPG